MGRQNKRKSEETCFGYAPAYTPETVGRMKGKEIQLQLRMHLKSTCGSKAVLVKRYAEHFRDCDHENLVRWTEDDVKKACAGVVRLKDSGRGKKQKPKDRIKSTKGQKRKGKRNSQKSKKA